MDFDSYDVDQVCYDEMFLPGGAPRAHCRPLHETLRHLPVEELESIQERVTRSFSTEGITFTVYGDAEAEERIIPVDCVPRVLTADEWRLLEAGLTQRLRALNLFLADIYDAARIVNDGVVPSDMVYGCPQYRAQMRGFQAPHGTWVAICGTDLVRTTDGFRVLEDNLRVPSGVSYMIANRKAVKANFRRLYRSSRVRDVEHYGRVLLTTLRELAPSGRSDPVIALLTPGVYNSAFYEHMFLAGELGAELVEGRDLVVHDGFVYMRTTSALRRVDVIYRRLDDDFIDPREFRRDSLLGVPGLMDACRRGNVTLANAPGTGVADDKSIYAYVPDMIRYFLGEEPLLASGRPTCAAAPKTWSTPSTTSTNWCSSGWGVRRLRHADRPPRHAERARGVRPPGTRRPGRLHRAADPGPVARPVPDRRPLRAAPRGPAPVRSARPPDPHRARCVLPRRPAPGQPGGELQPGRRRQGPLGARGLSRCLRAAPRACTG